MGLAEVSLFVEKIAKKYLHFKKVMYLCIVQP